MGEVELENQLQEAIVLASLITGHKLPENVDFALKLIRAILRQLCDFGYQDLTIPEIVLAFRLNCVCGLKYPSGSEVDRVELFGECISVDYVTRILNVYKTLRGIFDNNLKNLIDGY